MERKRVKVEKVGIGRGVKKGNRFYVDEKR